MLSKKPYGMRGSLVGLCKCRQRQSLKCRRCHRSSPKEIRNSLLVVGVGLRSRISLIKHNILQNPPLEYALGFTLRAHLYSEANSSKLARTGAKNKSLTVDTQPSTHFFCSELMKQGKRCRKSFR